MHEQIVTNGPEFARNGQVLHGKIAVASMTRLREALYSDAGGIDYTLSGYLNEKGEPVVRCTANGTLQLICQRCLDAYAYALDTASDLVLVENEKAFEALAKDGSDPADAVVAAPSLDVSALVEDEVLLDIPMFPRHPAAQCEARSGTMENGPRERNAFAALAALKAQDQGK